ncbi:hypothetical protein GCM10022215_28570 [Nocardioides fonticola]|uniref:PBP domain-containing protein n=1 Tax=Nocardioides fonticola TaxID=450363 RepID=A0ABP7XN86_9ACTN
MTSTRPHSGPRTGSRLARSVGVLTAVAALSGLAACGAQQAGDADAPDTDARTLVAAAQQQQAARSSADDARRTAALDALPQPVAGTVTVVGAGATGGDLLTPASVAAYRRGASTDRIETSFAGEDAGVAALCAGTADVVSTTRPLTADELAACQAVGLDVVTFRLGADALVLATRGGTDVGGDCLGTDQVRDLYRAGSPYMRWSQLGGGFDDVALRVGGPAVDASSFATLSRLVLGSAAPSAATVRSDYVAAPDGADADRTFLVGSTRDATLAASLRDRQRTQAQWADQARGQRQVLADARAEQRIALAEVAKGIRTGRPAAQQAADAARADAAAAAVRSAVARLTRYETARDRATVAVRDASAAARRVAALTGRLGIFRYSYYRLFADQLRAFEITAPGAGDCVFPSDATVTSGAYPLSSPLLLSTTTRSLDRGEVQAFLTDAVQHAPARAQAAGLVGLDAATRATELAWLDGTATPVIVRAAATPTAGAATEAPAAPAR